MIRDMPREVKERVRFLEDMGTAQKRDGGVLAFDRLRQVPPTTGRFLSIIALAAPEGAWIEVGTSGGYSALWLSLAARERGAKITTFDISERKAELARESFRSAHVDDIVTMVVGDALNHLGECSNIAFCFLDTEKDLYGPCYDIIVPRMVKGGILVADNVVSHQEVLRHWTEAVLGDQRVDAVVVPVGSGVLLARKA